MPAAAAAPLLTAARWTPFAPPKLLLSPQAMHRCSADGCTLDSLCSLHRQCTASPLARAPPPWTCVRWKQWWLTISPAWPAMASWSTLAIRTPLLGKTPPRWFLTPSTAFHCLPSLPSPSHALHPLLIPCHRFPSPSIAFHPLPCRYDTTTLLAASFRRIYDGDPDAPLALSACGASKFNAAAYGSFGRDPWTCDPALAPLSTQLASLVAQCSESAHAPLGGREVKRFAEGGFATMQVRADEPRAFHRLRMPSIAFSRLASPSHAFCGFHATVQLPLEASENASAAPPCFGEVRSFHRLLSPSLRPSHGLL